MTLTRCTVLAVAAAAALLSAPAVADAATVVPAGFAPASTSWLTTQHGYVLGYAGPTPYLLETTDGGARWSRLAAPPIALPDNHNHVALTVADARHAFVSDGTLIQATTDGGRHWSAVTLAGLAAPSYLSKIAIADGRVLALASTLGRPDHNTTQLYTGAVGAKILQPVAGMSIDGSTTYGDLAVGGGVQVFVGSGYGSGEYWTSTDAVHFTASPLPCDASKQTLLDGVRQGKVLNLCLGDPSDPSPGHMHKQLVTAAALGVRYLPSDAEAPLAGIIQGFASASDQNASIAATGGGVELLYSTTDGGKTWQTTQLDEDRFGLSDLHFVDYAFGTVVSGAPDAWNGSAVYRTTDSGHSWQQLAFK
ncbi:YCF48-related protein [Kutzneria buriramensis]|uniref:Photosynthesis system II assembly factor YCF48-like protein n=1 Tax=Kutzneria buriramensis TaxID=1045776 RepID=A0A3E0IA56_9PSEU|nr:YCF48-related protein [Kutzneria buriramensis]REH55529.1 photosynthesis system II assembly factor YCF48-like protein [Kutzneria buriramensis]